MTKIIEATIVPGAGAATKNLRHQLPELIKQFPEIANIHKGTINVLLGDPFGKPPRIENLYIEKWDCKTTPIRWWDEGPDRWHSPEVFEFLRIEFEYRGTVTPAWIIDCHDSQSHAQPQFFEIIAQRIESVSYGAPCRIHVPDTAL